MTYTTIIYKMREKKKKYRFGFVCMVCQDIGRIDNNITFFCPDDLLIKPHTPRGAVQMSSY